MPFPLPTPQGAGIGNLGTSPRPRFEGCARQPSGQEAHSENLFRKECQGCNEVRKPSCPAPQFNLPRRLSPPSRDSADRRLRPVVAWCYRLFGGGFGRVGAGRLSLTGNHCGDVKFRQCRVTPGVLRLLWLTQPEVHHARRRAHKGAWGLRRRGGMGPEATRGHGA